MTELDLHGLGLGTWENTEPDQCAESVRTALEAGYRHVDTAQAYENEESVGEGIAAASVPREEVFLATKVDTPNLVGEDVLATTRESLEKLGTEYLDLLYVHWPLDAYDAHDTLAAFQQLYDEGTIRHIGVSNFAPRHLEEARAVLDAPIFANQVEMHPISSRLSCASTRPNTAITSSPTRRWPASRCSTTPSSPTSPTNTTRASRRYHWRGCSLSTASRPSRKPLGPSTSATTGAPTTWIWTTRTWTGSPTWIGASARSTSVPRPGTTDAVF